MATEETEKERPNDTLANAEVQLSEVKSPKASSSKAENKEEGRGKRNLRKRRLNLNTLSSSLTCPQVCQFQHCGIQLSDGDSLEWHYQGHLAHELERLNHVRIKKQPGDLPDRHTRRTVRDLTAEKIHYRRERRQARRQSVPVSLERSTTTEQEENLTCPVCDSTNIDSSEYQVHVDVCLKTKSPTDIINNEEEEEEDLDIDGLEEAETYTWAGHTRVRATSLVQGGLRGLGFLTITQSDEDQVLDIEGDTEEQSFGGSQYTDADLIVPVPETPDEHEEHAERSSIQTVLLGKPSNTKKTNNICDDEKDWESETSNLDEKSKEQLIKLVDGLKEENCQLRKQSMCNICMDAHNKPLVSTVCWHVSCEECWMRALGTKKLCPQCKIIIQPKDLRRIYL